MLNGYRIEKEYFEDLFNKYSPLIKTLLNDERNPILLTDITIMEYGEKDIPEVGCDPKPYAIGPYSIRFYFWITRCQINLLGNISAIFGVIVDKYNTNIMHPKCIRLQEKMACVFVKALKGEKIKEKQWRGGNRHKDFLQEGFYFLNLEFIFAHEIGHAILRYDDYERTEYNEAKEYLIFNKYAEEEKTIGRWAKELASDYIAIKLLSMRFGKKSESKLANWSSILCLIHLFPLTKSLKEKSKSNTFLPQKVRINFLLEQVESFDKELIANSGITNLDLIYNVTYFINKKLENGC